MPALIAATVLALTPLLGMDHPSTPVYNEGWSQGIAELVNRRSRVHGYFVNWTDVFFFRGDAKSFNAFLKDYGSVPGKRRRLILHTGRLVVRSPWDKKPRDLKANWRLVTNSIRYVGPSLTQSEEPEREVLELWLGEIRDKDLVIPRGVRVENARG